MAGYFIYSLDWPQTPGRSAMSRFGTVPFRYHPPDRPRTPDRYPPSDWFPTHSMHPPDEVRRMLAELQEVAPAVSTARDADIRQQFEELLFAVGQVAADGRLLFIQVDT